jgi:hypothetical protein
MVNQEEDRDIIGIFHGNMGISWEQNGNIMGIE